MIKRLPIALVGCCALLFPAAAAATTRYAAPGGTASATQCTSPATPCTIHEAAQGTGVTSGDEVVIAPGDYSDTAGDLGQFNYVQPMATNVHGDPTKPRPTITLDIDSGFGAFFIASGVTLSHLRIETSAAHEDVTVGGGGVMQDVIARNSTPNSISCKHQAGVTASTIRDSACLSSGSDSRGAGVTVSTAAGAQTAILRNVTAVATGTNSYGLNYTVLGTGAVYNVDAKAVIARGTASDVAAQGLSGATSTITLDHSNYDGTLTGGTATVTSPTTNNNQTALPVLGADGFHQQASSPTIDAGGTTDSSSGTTDIDGQQRTIGSAVDIGADEFAHPTATSVACTPSSVTLGPGVSTCLVTVTDTSGAGPNLPTGDVALTSSGPGTFSAPCTLAMVTGTQASCAVSYTPTAAGTHQVTGTYPGDIDHDGSEGASSLAVSPAPSQQAAPPPDQCTALRAKLRRAKRHHQTAKVRKLRRKLRQLGC
jgi:hypothetical protein